MEPNQKLPGPDHPITVTPTGSHVVAKLGGRVIADTQNALTLQEASYPAVQYLPLEDVDPAALKDSDSSSYCPYKGEAGYYTLVASDGTELEDAAWTYRRPYDAVAEIATHVAFYPDKVQISID